MAHLFRCVCTECVIVDSINVIPVNTPNGQMVTREPANQKDVDVIKNHDSILGHKMEYIQEV